MTEQTLTAASPTSAPFIIQGREATLYLSGTWDGGTVQVQFKAPWSEAWISDTDYAYTADTVKLIEPGEATRIRAVISGGSGSESVKFEVKDRIPR